MAEAVAGEAQMGLAEPPLEVALHLLRACDWASRAQLLRLNKFWGQTVGREPHTWAVMCEALEAEHNVYTALDPTDPSKWKATFQKFFHFREICSERSTQQFSIKVCLRLRPAQPQLTATAGCTGQPHTTAGAATAPPRLVKLPLHQRLQLIQSEYGMTPHEARQALGKLMRGGAEPSDPFAAAVLPEDQLPNAKPAIGSAAFTAHMANNVRDDAGSQLGEGGERVLSALRKGEASPRIFVEQEVGRWLATAGSPRRTTLATTRMRRVVLQELNASDDAAGGQLSADLEWKADEEKRAAAVAEARLEIARLQEAAIDQEITTVQNNIAVLHKQLGLPEPPPTICDEKVTNAEPTLVAESRAPPQAAGTQSGIVSHTATDIWVADPRRGIRSFIYDGIFSGK